MIAPATMGVPAGTWVKWIEASRKSPGTAYVAFDGHQNGDFKNYIVRTTDFGKTWASVVGDLPAERVPHVLREDVENADLLYLGTEFGLFVSIDAGVHWTEVRANLPRVPVNDLQFHQRDHALVLGTHGRGIWILDHAALFRALAPSVMAASAHLFAPDAAVTLRTRSRLGHNGDMYFRGQNPAVAAAIDVWAKDSGAATLTITTAAGAVVHEQKATVSSGITRLSWNLRLPSLPAMRSGDDEEREPRPLTGHFVRPGRYTVRVVVAGQTLTQPLEVRDDPRQDAAPAVRTAWHDTLDVIAGLYRRVAADGERVRAIAGTSAATKELAYSLGALQQLVGGIYTGLQAQVGRPTADMRKQLASFTAVASALSARAAAVAGPAPASRP
jgi:hypothetical protein